MSIRLEALAIDQVESIIPILHDADEGIERIRRVIAEEVHLSYAAFDDDRLVGAVTMSWATDESEIIYIAVVPERRGHGAGKAIIADLVRQARQRGNQSMLVGTGDASLDNIAFYLKCGFRLDHVRHDYFAYIQPPMKENGIPLRDMMVLRMALT